MSALCLENASLLACSRQHAVLIMNKSLLGVVIGQVVSWNPTHDEVYSIQHYLIKFLSDLRQVGGFLWALWFPPPIKLTATI